MKKFIKFGALIMALLMLSGCFVACNGDDNTDDDGNNPNTPNTPAEEHVRFDGTALEMLYWENTNIDEYMISLEAANGGLVEENVYYRNIYAMDTLGVTTNWTPVTQDKTIETARNAHLSGGIYDTYCVYSQFGASLALEGLTTDLAASEYVDFSHPSYPDKLVKEATIQGKMYFMSGDISTNSLFMSGLVYYNKNLYETKRIEEAIKAAYGYDTIYAMVEDGKWTNDVLFALAKGVYEDTNAAIAGYDEGDTFGFATYDSVMDNFYYGAGWMTIRSTKAKGLTIDPDFKNHDKISGLIQQVHNFMKEDDAYSSGSTHVGARTNFADGRVLFYLAPGSHAYTTFRTVDGLEYGVLPVPKYDAEEDSYGASMSFPYAMYCVSSLSMNLNAACAYLQELSEQSYLHTRPAIFEQTMKLKYSDKAEDAVMWDMIIEAQSYDLGRIFARHMGGSESDQITVQTFRSAISNGNSGWNFLYISKKPILEGALRLLNVSISKLG